LENYLKEVSGGITFRRRMVVYLPNKKVKTRQLAQDLINLDKHRNAQCLEWFLDKPNKSPKQKPELRRAVGLCNDRSADLIIPDLGTLCQSIHFLSEVTALNDRQIYSITRPRDLILISAMDVVTMAAISSNIRMDVSKKTRARLKELKDDGVQLGSPDTKVGLRAAYVASRIYADDYAKATLPVVREIQGLGYTTLTAIADMLNRRKIHTARGGKFHATTVKNLLARSKYL